MDLNPLNSSFLVAHPQILYTLEYIRLINSKTTHADLIQMQLTAYLKYG